MTSIGTFSTSDMAPTDYVPEITTGLPTGHLHLVKTYRGAVTGRSITQFSCAFDQATGVGGYVAMESFEGTVDGRQGTFNFMHSATTSGQDRSNEFGVIVPGSGTGELAGITGAVRIVMDADGERMEFDHNL
jgi:Protein of unknown function (DUF3224)